MIIRAVGVLGIGVRLVKEVGARFYRAVILGSGRFGTRWVRNTGVSLVRLMRPNVILGSSFMARGIRISLTGRRGTAATVLSFRLRAYATGLRWL